MEKNRKTFLIHSVFFETKLNKISSTRKLISGKINLPPISFFVVKNKDILFYSLGQSLVPPSCVSSKQGILFFAKRKGVKK